LEGGVELRRYAAIVWRRKWLVAAIVTLAVGGAWALGNLDGWRPRYRSSVTLLLTTPPGQPVPFPVDAVRTLPLAREAARIAEVSEDPADLVARISIIRIPDSSLVGIQVEDADPRRAALLANGFAEAYLARLAETGTPDRRTLEILRQAHEDLRGEARRVEKTQGDPTLKEWELHWLRVRDEAVARAFSDAMLRGLLGSQVMTQARVVDPAVPPAEPVQTALEQQVRTVGGVAGVALLGALTLVFLIEYLDDRVRTEADVERALGLPVLATLPSPRRLRRAMRRFAAIGRRRVFQVP
jgi:capsular polysaccharide biosynthesis protein